VLSNNNSIIILLGNYRTPQRYYDIILNMSYKIVVYVPLENSDSVREAIASAGGGKSGKYSHCTFSTLGIGRFKPGKGARPHIGQIGKLESVKEERIEVTCENSVVGNVIAAIKKVHPYEEVAMDVYELTNW